jgi:hypothetical protein
MAYTGGTKNGIRRQQADTGRIQPGPFKIMIFFMPAEKS